MSGTRGAGLALATLGLAHLAALGLVALAAALGLALALLAAGTA